MMAGKKVALDQLLFAPPFMASILSLLRLLDGDKPAVIVESLKKNYFKLLTTNWQVWPFIQMANFYFVPLNYQVILVNSASVAWNTYVAYVAEQKAHEHNPSEF